jgi:hypothetical protein
MVAGLLLGLVVVAGCGDDESGDARNGDTAAETAARTGGAGTARTGDPKAIPVAPTAELERSRRRCKQIVDATPRISEGAKARLRGVCAKAPQGLTDPAPLTARELCEDIADDAVPKGSPGREAALEACRDR